VSTLAAGQLVSHYRIVRTLGEGGMGEVYLAEDTRLGRQIALKVLVAETGSDPDRRTRFEREARAVAALNHPGIVTIHSVEEDQGRLFLTMEVVEGGTLSGRIPRDGMTLEELLRISIPLADAVGAAHQRGITHRDLKPANVMIGNDGRVKVLDFGLAKQHTEETFQTQTALQPAAHATAEGKILGTVAYMSPEQAQGKPVDQRSDIFSLGVVLFEMATGERPFKGDSSVSVLSSVLKDTPPLVTDVRPQLPRDLGRMVKRCLAKDPEERYQTAKDLRNDLKVLKEESDSGDLVRGSAVASAASLSSASVVVAPRARRNWLWTAAAAVLVAGGMSAAWSAWPTAPPRVTATRQITNDGVPKRGTVTDGARVYFVVERLQGTNDRGSTIAQVAATGGETVELTPSDGAILDIDRNGTELLMSEAPATGDDELYTRPILGGTARRVGDIKTNSIRIYGPSAAWTPDKSRILYTRGSELRIAESDGSGSRTLLTAPGIPWAPRVSPDGARLRYSVQNEKTDNSSLWEANADGTGAHPLLAGWTGASSACCGAWSRDGRYYVFNAGGNIWARKEARGSFRWGAQDPVQLTFGPLVFWTPSPSLDGKSLFAVGNLFKGRLVRYDAGKKQFIPYLRDLSAEDVVISSDGQWMAYVTYPDAALWRSRVDGSDRVQLTFPPMQAALPRWSPDGSQIAFFALTPSETTRLYLVAASGGAPRRATTGKDPEADPSWSPDGRRLAFGGRAGGMGSQASTSNIQVLDLGTGKIVPLPGSNSLFSPRWSPDGRYILGVAQDSLSLRLFDVATQSWSDLVRGSTFVGWPSWSPDSRSITYEQNPEIRRITLADRRIETIASIVDRPRAVGVTGQWLGAAPDGSPLILLEAGTHEIYALDWDAP
jgi:Tol biopolymer transport system component